MLRNTIVPPSQLLPKNLQHYNDLHAFVLIVTSLAVKFDRKKDLYDDVQSFNSSYGFFDRKMLKENVIRNSVDYLLAEGMLKNYYGYFVTPSIMNDIAVSFLRTDSNQRVYKNYIIDSTRPHWHLIKRQIYFCLLMRTRDVFNNKLELFDYADAAEFIIDTVQTDNSFELINSEFLNLFEEKDQDLFLRCFISRLFAYRENIILALVWFQSLDKNHRILAYYPLMSFLSLNGSVKHIRMLEAYSKDFEQTLPTAGSDFVADLLEGNYDIALVKSTQLHRSLCKSENHNRKELPQSLGYFHALLMARSDAENLKKAAMFVRASVKEYRSYKLEKVVGVTIGSMILKYLAAKQDSKRYNADNILRGHLTLSSLLWNCLLSLWSGIDNYYFPKSGNMLDITFNVNPRHTYDLYKAGAFNDPQINERVSKIINQYEGELQQVALVDFLKPEPKWKELLSTFEHIAKKSEQNTSSNDQSNRLIWRVNFEREQIQPILQKMQKNGKWSGGRSVALKTLSNQPPNGLTEQDHLIRQHLTKGFGWYNEEYNWNYDDAFRAMVGHPLLLTLKEPYEPITLGQEEAELVVKTTKEGTQLSFSHPSSKYFIKESTNNYKYIVWTDELIDLHDSFVENGNASMTFPEEAQARVLDACSHLSKRIGIRGDFDDPNRVKQKAKTDLVIRLELGDDGLLATVLVKPLPKEQLTLVPGVGRATLTHRSKDNQRIDLLRNIKKEIDAVNDLKTTIPTLASLDDNTIAYVNIEEALDFLGEVKEKLPKLELQWPKGEGLKIGKVASMKDVNVQVKGTTDWFELSGKLKIDDERIWDFKELLEASAGGNSSYVRLDDGSYLKLQSGLRKRLKELASVSHEHNGKHRIHQLGAGAVEQIIDEAGATRTDKKWKENVKLRNELLKFQPELPSNLEAELRPYQEEGYNWLSRLHSWGVGACLADDMGLGKTIQAIALMLKHADNGASLVIAPSSVCGNWHKEIARFAPTLQTYQLENKDRDQTIEELEAFDVLVVSYGLIQSNPDLLAQKKWNFAVLDEAHAIKNASSIRSKAAMKLNAQFRLITTGTPVQNHIGELWNLFQFMNPGFLGSYENFNERFVNGKTKEEISLQRKALNRYIKPFILRRNKRDVLDDLPQKTEITLSIEQSEDEKALYEVLRQKAVKEIEMGKDQGDAVHMQILAQISKLRLASCNPKLVDGGGNLKSSKMTALENLVADLISAKHKSLIFSQFTKHLALVKEMLDAKGLRYEYLDGSTSQKGRDEAITRFQRGSCDIFLISLKAGGVGLNLTAADYVIHLDPWWNPAIEDQASDRAHRIGQTRPVTVYRLVSEGTIEEKIVQLHHNKRNMANNLLNDTDQSAKISSEELFKLIQ